MDLYITLVDAVTFITSYVMDTDAWDCAEDDAEREKADQMKEFLKATFKTDKI